MKWRSFGRSGLKVTELCLGTMTLGGQADDETSSAILDNALEGGIRFFDTADCYPVVRDLEQFGRTEKLVGKWLATRGTRGDIVIASKSYFPAGVSPLHRGNARRHLIEACDASLRRLGIECIDLYYCHGWDTSVPIDETLRALEDLRAAGKILYAGLSNVRAHEVTEALLAAQSLGATGFAGLQPRYNLVHREAEESLFPLAARFGLGVAVYNPIAGGLLSGKYRPGQDPVEGTRFALGRIGKTYRDRYWNDSRLRAAETLRQAAEASGVSPVTAAVAWVLRQETVTSAIVGASRPEQLSAHFDAVAYQMTPELEAALSAIWYDLPRTPPDLDSPRLDDWHSELT